MVGGGSIEVLGIDEDSIETGGMDEVSTDEAGMGGGAGIAERGSIRNWCRSPVMALTPVMGWMSEAEALLVWLGICQVW